MNTIIAAFNARPLDVEHVVLAGIAASSALATRSGVPTITHKREHTVIHLGSELALAASPDRVELLRREAANKSRARASRRLMWKT